MAAHITISDGVTDVVLPHDVRSAAYVKDGKRMFMEGNFGEIYAELTDAGYDVSMSIPVVLASHNVGELCRDAKEREQSLEWTASNIFNIEVDRRRRR